MTKVFISYSRKDKVAAGKLTETLAKCELETWIDWEDIPPTADWMEQIHKGIESADAFLFLLSPDSILSEVCGREVDHAVLNGKRLIPVVVRDVNPKDVHPALAKINWIYEREQDDFSCAIEKLLSAIRTDLAWVEAHRRLQVKALEWNTRKDPSRLLRGKELREAEENLASSGQKDPQPTDLQRLYLLASRRREAQTRNMILGVGAFALFAMAALSVFAFNQRNIAKDNAATAVSNQYAAQTAQANAIAEANTRATAQAESEAQTKLARGGELAMRSILTRDLRLDQALLFSVESFRSANTIQARNVLIQNTQVNPHLVHFFHLGSNVVSVGFSPKLDVFVAGSNDGTLTVWDMESYHVIGQPIQGVVAPNDITFSPDGKSFAVANSDGTLVLWDLATRQQLGQVVTNADGGSRRVVFSPDGKTLAADGKNGLILFWDVATMKSTGQVDNGGCAALAFSPDGKKLVVGGRGVRLWDMTTLQPIGGHLPSDFPYVSSLVFSADGKSVASGGSFSSVELIDLTQDPPTGSGFAVPDNEEGQGTVFSVALSPVDPILATGGTANTVILWDAHTQKMIGQPLLGHTSYIKLISFSQDGTKFASYDYDNTIILWEVNPHQALARQLLGEEKALQDLAFIPNGKILATYPEDGSIVSLDVTSFQPIRRQFALPSGSFSKLAFSPNGKTYAIATENIVTLFDIATSLKIGRPFSDSASYVSSLAFSPDGKKLAIGYEDGSLIFLDVVSQQPFGKSLAKHSNAITNLAFSRDGEFVVSTDGDTAIFWESVSTQPTAQSLDGVSTSVYSLVFSPDGKTFISDSDLGIDNWDTATRKITDQIKLPTNNGYASGLSLSSDGKIVASILVSRNGVFKGILLWDVTTQQVITTLFPEQGDVDNVIFSPDKMLFSSSNRFGAVSLWNLEIPFLLEQACQRVGRNFTRAEWAQYFPGETYRATCPQWPLEPEPVTNP